MSNNIAGLCDWSPLCNAGYISPELDSVLTFFQQPLQSVHRRSLSLYAPTHT